MRSSFYQDLIPLTISEQPKIESEQDMLYLGRESLMYLRDVWQVRAACFLNKGKACESILDRMEYVSESHSCDKRVIILDDLIPKAESKPSVFRDVPLTSGTRITCFVPESKRFVDCTLLKVESDEDSNMILEVVTLDKKHRHMKLPARKLTVITTESYHYLKYHPRFFRTYLSVCVKNSDDQNMVEEMISALPS